MTRVRRAPSGRVPPPTAPEVARRLLCVIAAEMRASMERAGPAPGGPLLPDFLRPERACEELRKWIEREGLLQRASKAETYWLTAPMGELGEDVDDAERSAHASTPLYWALGHIPHIPPYDSGEGVGFEQAMRVPIYQSTTHFIAGATLRPRADIEAVRNVAALWTLRSDILFDERKGECCVGALAELRRNFEDRLEGLMIAGVMLPLSGEDLRAFGKPYNELNEHEHATCEAIARERLRALNWLCGHGADWDEVSTDPPQLADMGDAPEETC